MLGLRFHIATPSASSTSLFQFLDQLALIVHSNSLDLTGWKRAETSTPRLRTQPALTTTDVAPTAWSIGTVMIWSVVSLW